MSCAHFGDGELSVRNGWDRVTFFAIHEMPTLVVAFCAIRCIEVLDARSATRNRLAKHRLHGVIERHNRSPAQPMHLTVRMEPGAKKNFVGINIPNSCDHLLMH